LGSCLARSTYAAIFKWHDGIWIRPKVGRSSRRDLISGVFILFLGLLNGGLFIIYYVKRFSLIRTGLLIAVLPIICAFLYSVIKGGSMFDEGSGGGGYLWFLIASLPLGLLFIVIGLIVKLVKRFKS
jgi:hypothetical protein